MTTGLSDCLCMTVGSSFHPSIHPSDCFKWTIMPMVEGLDTWTDWLSIHSSIRPYICPYISVHLFVYHTVNLTTVHGCRCRTWWWLDRMTTCRPERHCCCGVEGQWTVTQGCTSKTSQRPGAMAGPSSPYYIDTGE